MCRPVIREDLSLTATQAGSAGVLATVGAVVGRLGMGTILDVLGPRMGNSIIMFMFAPPVFLMSMVTNAAGFQAERFFIGISLCAFVCCQFWVGSMFNVRIVGTANAISAGGCRLRHAKLCHHEAVHSAQDTSIQAG